MLWTLHFKDSVATKGDMTKLEQHIDFRIAELRVDLLKWMFGLLFAQAALIATLVKLL